MNGLIPNIAICTKEKIFHPRNEDWGIPCEDHSWKIFVFDNDSKVGMAICTKCARVSGGWIRDE